MKITKKGTKSIAIFLSIIILFSSCASTTIINSSPNGAKLYLNDEYVGETSYIHKDTKIVGSTTSVRLEKDGYETYKGSFSRNEKVDGGAIIGGIFLLFPFLWTMKYKPSRTYELKKIDNKEGNSQNKNSKSDRLRELKKLFDEGIINQEEFEKEKKKILEEK